MKVDTDTDTDTTDAFILGILVHPGLEQRPEPVEVKADSLPALRNLLDCQWVEHVRTPIPGVAMWVDEEGALSLDTPVNVRCSGILHPGLILGRVLLTGITSWGGMASLDSNQIDALANRGIVALTRPEARTDLQWLTDEECRQLTSRVAARLHGEATS